MKPYFDPEYDQLNQWINPPRVSIDNETCSDCTLIKVDSMNRPGILLEVVQVLSDLDLIISKAYITSDGSFFLDVFHVTDQHGRQIVDKKTIDYIEKALGPESIVLAKSGNTSSGRIIGMHSTGDHTAIELTGTDRPGLMSEIFAILANLRCNVIAAELWTHNMRIACVLYVNDEVTGHAIDDPNRLSVMDEQLTNLLRGVEDDGRVARTNFSIGSTHVGRRLHQLMFADRDYELDDGGLAQSIDDQFKPIITIDQCQEKGYSVVNVRCKDRSKLLFDIVCTLTDMQFVVFHASVSSDGPYAIQELYIRQKDGCILSSEDQKERVVKCLEAAILRRVTEGLSLELCGRDRVGFASDVTRVLRENGLSVTRADVSTVGENAVNVFYIRDASGLPVDMKIIDALRQQIGQTVMLNIKKIPAANKPQEIGSNLGKTSFSFGSLFGRFLT